MPSAIVFDRPGGPDVLKLRTVAPLHPADHEVLIAVEAAGVNHTDLIQRRGQYPVPPTAPPGLGLECAGKIAAVGSAVKGWKVGDKVCALLDGGGYAEQVVVPAGQVMPIPAGISMTEAAAVPEVACTVYSNLAMIAGFQPGRTLLVHGGGGGIGSFAIQWAKAIGSRAYTTVGSDQKKQAALSLGATEAINYRKTDFVSEVLKATNNTGVDAVLDIVGAMYLQRNIECLAEDGHLVIIAGDLIPTTVDLWSLMSRRASVTATLLRPRSIQQKAEIVAGVTRDMLPLIEKGAIHPVVDTVFPLAEADRAHHLLESGRTVGKIVLQVGQ